MAFISFTKLCPEVREMVWIEAVHNESNGRIFFLHMESLCVMPTRNNISSLLGVNPESRKVALRHYPVKISIYKLPQQMNNSCLSFAKWCARTANVQWEVARSGENGVDTGGSDRRELELYWHHHVLPNLGAANNQLINDFGAAGERQQPRLRGCIYLKATNEQFLMSYGVSNRDNATKIRSAPSHCAHLVTQDPRPDLCAYQIALDRKAHILGKESLHKYEIPRRCMSLRLPIEVRRTIRDLFIVEVKKDSRVPQNNTNNASGSAPILTRVTNSVYPLWQDPEFQEWMAAVFPRVHQLLQPPRPRLLTYEVLGSQSRTLVGRVEAETKTCLGI
ncbi:hypothetical protein PG985_010304 [Apiospora marii]|uniref:2EXR domain-containing protein n=1 Tax=Apiospora marii TaxID=335849 RepID=A0ABR1RM05_9PEZI